MRRNRDATYEQAWSEFGPSYVLWHLVPRRLAPWIAASVLWVVCVTQNDMVVTNLFQVPTLCESVYQQVQFGKLRTGPIAAAIALAIACGLAMATIAAAAHPKQSPMEGWSRGSGTLEPVAAHRFPIVVGASLIGWGLVSVTVLLPLASLAMRIGWESRIVDGTVTRSWSLAESARSLWHAADYSTEIGWSLSLSFWSGLLAITLAMLAITLFPGNRRFSPIVLVMGFLLAIPGPLVNLGVLWLFDSGLPSAWRVLGDRTLLGPILALQCRCLPVAYGILWIARVRYDEQYGQRLSLESALPWYVQQWIWIRFARGAIVTAALVAFFIAFGDLASYLLVQPPGVTTVAMRLFDLLHYGIRNREASLALVLASLAALPSLWLARNVQRASRDSVSY
jgi:ABC-type Fe3+ transport system permease subunit